MGDRISAQSKRKPRRVSTGLIYNQREILDRINKIYVSNRIYAQPERKTCALVNKLFVWVAGFRTTKENHTRACAIGLTYNERRKYLTGLMDNQEK